MSTEEFREKFIRSYITEEQLTRLIAETRKAADSSVAPYSNFHVGACLLTHDGDYITGCNIENISFTQSVHGEGCAISKAVSAGKKNFKAVAVYAKAKNYDGFTPCCGECRQFLAEFANFLPIIIIHETGNLMFEMLHEMLPLTFVEIGTTAPKAEQQTAKYDTIVGKANVWILKDTNPQTRSEMRQLLQDWKFDEIYELMNSQIHFENSGVLTGKYRAGTASVNFRTVQELFEAFALADTESKGKIFVTSSEDNLAESLAHRIVATLAYYEKSVALSAKGENSEAQYIVNVVSKGEKEYEIRITDGQGKEISKDLVNKIHESRKLVLYSKPLNEFYDYQTNKLVSKEKYLLS